MKTSEIDARVDFQVVLRIIPETAAYSVIIGEMQDGQFTPTDRRPESCDCDWEEVKENPLAPGQLYVAAADLYTLIFDIMARFDDVVFLPNMLVFTIKDFPVTHEAAQKKDEE
nr:MAG TPA: hypothetical protein [Microviridae sp.]